MLSEELNDLYYLPKLFRVIKSRMRWAGNVARMGDRRGVYGVLVRERDNLGDPSVNARIITWIFRKCVAWLRTRTSLLRIGKVGGYL